MCRKITARRLVGAALLAVGMAALPAGAQAPARGVRAEWRRIGNSALDLALASPAGGPVASFSATAQGRRLPTPTP